MHGRISGQSVLKLPIESAAVGPAITQQYNVLRRRWKAVASGAIAALLIACAFLAVATPLYTSSTQLMLDPRKQNVMQSQAVVQGLTLEAGSIESEVALVLSYNISRRVVEKLNLDKDPEFQAGTGGLISRMLNGGRSLVGRPAEPAVPVELEKAISPEKADAILRLRQALAARRSGVSYIMEVTATSRDPAKAARLANTLAEAYLVEQLEARFEAAKRASGHTRTRQPGCAGRRRPTRPTIRRGRP